MIEGFVTGYFGDCHVTVRLQLVVCRRHQSSASELIVSSVSLPFSRMKSPFTSWHISLALQHLPTCAMIEEVLSESTQQLQVTTTHVRGAVMCIGARTQS